MDFPPNERDKNLKVIGIRIRPNQMWVKVQPRGTSLPQEQLFQRHSAVWPMIAGVKHVHMILIPHSQKGACVCEYLSATYLLLLFFLVSVFHPWTLNYYYYSFNSHNNTTLQSSNWLIHSRTFRKAYLFPFFYKQYPSSL